MAKGKLRAVFYLKIVMIKGKSQNIMSERAIYKYSLKGCNDSMTTQAVYVCIYRLISLVIQQEQTFL